MSIDEKGWVGFVCFLFHVLYPARGDHPPYTYILIGIMVWTWASVIALAGKVVRAFADYANSFRGVARKGSDTSQVDFSGVHSSELPHPARFKTAREEDVCEEDNRRKRLSHQFACIGGRCHGAGSSSGSAGMPLARLAGPCRALAVLWTILGRGTFRGRLPGRLGAASR